MIVWPHGGWPPCHGLVGGGGKEEAAPLAQGSQENNLDVWEKFRLFCTFCIFFEITNEDVYWKTAL